MTYSSNSSFLVWVRQSQLLQKIFNLFTSKSTGDALFTGLKHSCYTGLPMPCDVCDAMSPTVVSSMNVISPIWLPCRTVSSLTF